MRWDKKRVVAAAISAAVVSIVTIIALNLIGPGKQIEERIVHRYAVADAQFRRELGTLLGPPIIAGNRVENLENGHAIWIKTSGEVLQGARYFPELQPEGTIYEYSPTMFHCKMMIVDRLLASVGSTNFDNRSFSLNDEANLNIYDREFAERVSVVFEQDLQRARKVTLQMWQERPLREKVIEHVSALFAAQL